MKNSQAIRQSPHFLLPAKELATWLDSQSDESWWTVDGDPFLTQRLDFPCPHDELAAFLATLDRRLLLLDSRTKPKANGEVLSAKQLDDIAFVDEYHDRVFQMSWEAAPEVDWLLIEDKDTGSSSLGLNDIE